MPLQLLPLLQRLHASSASAAAAPRDTSVQRRAWKGGSNKASAKFQGAPPSTGTSLRYRLLHQPGDRSLLGRQAGPRLVGGRTPHPTLFSTDAEIMSPEERALHEDPGLARTPEKATGSPPPGGDREAIYGGRGGPGEPLHPRYRLLSRGQPRQRQPRLEALLPPLLLDRELSGAMAAGAAAAISDPCLRAAFDAAARRKVR